MNSQINSFVLCAAAVLMLAACGQKPKGVENPQPSVYYWRTTLSLDADERAFLSQAGVGKMFLHVFDVTRPSGSYAPAASGTPSNLGGEPYSLMPANTLIFEDRVPDGIKIIPTVFFAPGVLAGNDSDSTLALKVLRRIDQMMEQNGYDRPDEVQMDYDWTASDEAAYFDLLKQMGKILHKEGRNLSATIRLHQLSKAAPPVGYGVLMVYNVGNFRDEAERNSILTTEAVAPYMPALAKYELPLCAALPVYGWNLLFQNHLFRQIVRGVDLSDTTLFRRIDSTHYESMAYMAAPADGIADEGGQRIYPGDVVRVEQPSLPLLMETRQMLELSRPGVCDQVVIYHLDSKFIKHNGYEIQKLYSKP